MLNDSNISPKIVYRKHNEKQTGKARNRLKTLNNGARNKIETVTHVVYTVVS